MHAGRSELQRAFICPIAGCQRHRKGFTRKWNLNEHVRRCHGLEYLGSYAGEAEISASEPEKEPESSEKIRRDITSELSTLQVKRDEIDEQMKRLNAALASLGRE
jgi:hypothetical protein